MAKITLIGSGKTATALGKALSHHHTFCQVWSRNQDHAKALADTLKCGYTGDLNAIGQDADIYILAVADDAIGPVADRLRLPTQIIAHTSGIKSKDVLKNAGPDYGVFYPFVSMTKETDTHFSAALFMVEGSNRHTEDHLEALAKDLAKDVRKVKESERQSLHLAAVFANNFTNHMYSIAEKIAEENNLKFDDLRPLIAAHMANILKISPSQLQTGPAIRGDESTIRTHLRLLDHNIEWKRLYLSLTEAIQADAKKK